MNKIDQQEFQRQRQELLDKKAQLFQNNPQIAKWVKTRTILWRVVAIYWILHSVFSCIVFLQSGSFRDIVMEIIKLLFQLLILYASMNPEGGWRINLILYLWSGTNFFLVISSTGVFMETLSYVVYMPLLGVLMLMEILVPFLLLGSAIYLTAIPKHRALSEQTEEMLREFREGIKNLGK